MRLDECIKRITRYLSSGDNHPRIVNFNNIEDLSKLKEYFNVGDNCFLTVRNYSKKDESPSIDKLFNDLSKRTGKLFLTEFTTHMKLKGEKELEQFLYQILHFSFSDCKMVVFCYQCEQNLKMHDKRLETFIYYVDGKYTQVPKLLFVSNKGLIPANAVIADGIDNVASIIESQDFENIYVHTAKSKRNYIHSLYLIVEKSSPFDILCSKDGIMESLDELMGSEEQWFYALKEVIKHKSWNNCITNIFGNCNNLELVSSNWEFFNSNEKWLYFIALKLYGARNNWCLNKAAKETIRVDNLLRNVYRCLLTEDCKDKDFWGKYNQRKALIDSFGNDGNEVIDYCEMVKSKGENMLYYITDKTNREKELIFGFLDKYGTGDNYKEMLEVIKHIYPDLYSYLSQYQFKNELLDNYFQTYKYEKVINKIFPDFKKIVEEQAQKRDYNQLLPPRAAKIEAIDKNGSALYFVDAMGVEFLSFIMGKCRELDMTARVTVCRCELPSLTEHNKEFIEVFEKGGSTLISGKKGIKELDKIKHEGMEGSDYETTKLPIHLMSELEIIEEIIENINEGFIQGKYKRAIMISDHGTSRLAVINENENKWEMATQGKHSGRCCPINEIDEQPAFATEENGFWVLANYDRFKGGRKSDVEVHGGASLEEIVVPIIEITKTIKDIEISILTPKIKFNIREKNAGIKIFSKTRFSNMTVNVNGKFYDAETDDGHTFVIKLPDLIKARTYKVKVYSDNNLLKDDLKFIAEKEGFATRKLF